jgi:hypothetical protein
MQLLRLIANRAGIQTVEQSNEAFSALLKAISSH